MKIHSSLFLSGLVLAPYYCASGFLSHRSPIAPSTTRASRHVLQQIIFADSPDPSKPENFPNTGGVNRAAEPPEKSKKKKQQGADDFLDTDTIQSSIISGSRKVHDADKTTRQQTSTVGTPRGGRRADELDVSGIRGTILTGTQTPTPKPVPPQQQPQPQQPQQIGYESETKSTQIMGRSNVPAPKPVPPQPQPQPQKPQQIGYSSETKSTQIMGRSNVPNTIISAGAPPQTRPAPAAPSYVPPPPPPQPVAPAPAPAPLPKQTLSPADREKIDYETQIRSLANLLKDTESQIAEMRVLASRIKEMELKDPSLAALPEEAAGLKMVLSEAKAAVEVHGPSSPQALDAWRDVEECAAGQECTVGSTGYRYSAAAIKAHHYYNAAIDSVFLQEAIDAFDTVDNLRRFTTFEKDRLSQQG